MVEGCRVLLASDASECELPVRCWLEEAGHTVLALPLSELSTTRPREAAPCCLLLDLSASCGEGALLGEPWVMRALSAIPTVVIAADGWSGVAALKAGAIDCLARDALTPVILASAIDRAVNASARPGSLAAALAPELQGQLIDHADEAIVAWQPRGGIVAWSHGAERLYGYTTDESIGRVSYDLLRTRFPDGFADFEAALLRDGAWVGDLSRLTKRGDRLIVRARMVRITLPGGERVIVEATRDVTSERRAAERQRFLIEASRVLTSSLDVEATLSTLTRLAVPAMADWCVVDLLAPDGALARLAISHRDPELAPVAERLLREYPRVPPNQSHTLWTVLAQPHAFLDQAVAQERFVSQARDTEHLTLLRRLGYAAELVVPLTTRGRALGAMTLVLSDDSRSFGPEDVEQAEKVGRWAGLAIENAQLYAEARAAEGYYRSLFAGTADGVVVTDEHGQYLETNEAATRMLGYTLDELREIRAREGSVSVEDPDLLREAWAVLRSEGRVAGTWTMRRKDGSTLPVDSTMTRIAHPDRVIYLGVWRDATQRVQLERLQRDFFAMVAHDLRTPLAAIRAGAQLLQRRGAYQESVVTGIISGTDRMARLIADLADVVRLEGGQLQLRRRLTDLYELSSEITVGFPPEEQARVAVIPPATPVTGSWDADRIGQVLQNLIGNALIHAPDSTVRVTMEQQDTSAIVRVADNGPGISAEHLAQLFDRFYRPGASGAGGLGLGLYIARMLVDAHGGRIGAESVPGAGSVFWFTLPESS